MSTDGINGETYTPEGTGPNGETLIGDDLKLEARETLAKYLSDLTTDPINHNAFPIDPATPLNEFALRNADGTPSDFTTGGNDSTEGFTETMPAGDTASSAAVPVFETLSNSGKFNPQLGDFLNKNTQEDGHNLLRDVVSTYENDEPGVGSSSGQAAFPNPSAATPMQQKISSILSANNKFDPMPTSSPYIEDNEFTSPGIPIEQGGFGIYDPDADRTSIKDLQKIAYSQLLRQTGHNMGTGQSPTSAAARLGAIAPSGVQVGRKTVNTNKLRASTGYHAPDRPQLRDAHLEYDDIDGSPLLPRRSVGVLNNPYEPFASPAPGAMAAQIATAATAFAEIMVAATVFAAIMTIIQAVAVGTTIPSQPKNMKKGQNRRGSAVAKMLARMGIPQTTQPMWRCVCYGILAFFKIAPSSVPPVPGGTPPPASGPMGVWWSAVILGSGGDILSLFASAQKSHGYYATILRSIRRDLKRLLSDLAPTDPPTMFNTIMHLNNYSSWRFFCTLAIMGDRFLDSKTHRFAIVDSINGMPNNGQTRQGKSRAWGGSNKLAWRHRSSPSLILLPKKYANAYSLFGFAPDYAKKTMGKIGDKTNSAGQYFNNTGAGPNTTNRRKVIQGGHRLSQDDVTQVENELDAEYMPFYFHDLRTNEVIAFPAFIEDVKDSYSVSYADSAGYGRIDPVKIYQNTSRSVSVSWTMVATSKEDFDSLWWSINKMVSMCYPQFSMGKPVRAGTKKFIMPFSQIPTASPVIRLRVGDVLRSNYSRFNLARIFGVSEAIPAASAYSSTGGTTPGSGGTDEENAAELAAWQGAPFDLTYSEKAEAAQEVADATAEAETNANDAEVLAHVDNQPTSQLDMSAGYIPGDSSDLGLGVAFLLANSAGYTTYDMDEDKTQPTGGYYPPGDWLGLFPPPTATSGELIEDTAFRSRTYSDMKVNILSRRVSNEDGDFPSGVGELNIETDVNEELRSGQYAEYLVTPVNVDDPADPYGPVSAKHHTHAYVVTSEDLYPIFPPPVESTAAPPSITLEEQVFDIYDFFRPDKNAVVRSFEVAGGRGLAGVITSFDMDWKEAQWDMSGLSRRAPQMVKCSISFSPIHDIIPGLDNNGAMRAYNYPVGKINSGMAEDFYSPGAAPAVTGRMSAHRGSYADVDANIETVEGINDAISEGYGGGEVP
jgi:hypothetical protein